MVFFSDLNEKIWDISESNTDLGYRRGGAAGNKLKMTLGLPVYVFILVYPWRCGG
jgi:hypothetical protein